MTALLSDREIILQQIRDGLRPGQRRLADWQGGPLAVSAVPGSGKSTGMAAGAATAIARFGLHARQQLVLVTFTRSAAANLKAKVRRHLRALNLPQNSFVVQTLHGLALTIATRNPEISGISLDTTTLVSPNQGSRLMRAAVEQWIAASPALYQRLIEGRQFDGEEAERLRRQSVLRTEVLPDLAYTVVHEAKSSGLLPQNLAELAETFTQRLTDDQTDYSLLTVAAGLYERYQALLLQRSLIDYDDMILAALKTLEDEALRRLWQSRTFAIFEDEAQDSSPLQTQLLEILAVDPEQPQALPNLVRVGDPNQAINSTFTPADPVFFNQFCDRCAQLSVPGSALATIDQAGRSSAIIMTTANFVLRWVNQHSPLSGSETPFRPQDILPVPTNDPQPDANPAPLARGVVLKKPQDTVETVRQLARQVQALAAVDANLSFAVLVRENRQARFLREILEDPQQLGFDFAALNLRIYDVGQRDRKTQVPLEMLRLLQFIERPHSPDYLKATLRVLVDRQRVPTQDLNPLAIAPEQFLYPGPLDPPFEAEPARLARRYCTGLLRARLELPAYHLIPFFGSTLGYDQSELATADKLAARISQQTAEDSRLSAMIAVLQEIVSAEQFDAVEAEETESVYTRTGQLTIMTMHKAKGLDWDAVFLPFLHERQIPGTVWVPPQTEFLGDFTLAEVARAQIRAHTHSQLKQQPIPDVGSAWQQAAALKKAEEYRLLYVAITRAKRFLWLSAAQQAPFTWSKPDRLQAAEPCPVLPALSQALKAAAG
ncbi:MAG: ATP-dependent helicase [Leptolyngbya sp. SIO4C1]|nr:ATP-dependent helicase [Leptolyngbya sp. SIO4C1]